MKAQAQAQETLEYAGDGGLVEEGHVEPEGEISGDFDADFDGAFDAYAEDVEPEESTEASTAQTSAPPEAQPELEPESKKPQAEPWQQAFQGLSERMERGLSALAETMQTFVSAQTPRPAVPEKPLASPSYDLASLNRSAARHILGESASDAEVDAYAREWQEANALAQFEGAEGWKDSAQAQAAIRQARSRIEGRSATATMFRNVMNRLDQIESQQREALAIPKRAEQQRELAAIYAADLEHNKDVRASLPTLAQMPRESADMAIRAVMAQGQHEPGTPEFQKAATIELWRAEEALSKAAAALRVAGPQARAQVLASLTAMASPSQAALLEKVAASMERQQPSQPSSTTTKRRRTPKPPALGTGDGGGQSAGGLTNQERAITDAWTSTSRSRAQSFDQDVEAYLASIGDLGN